MIKGDIGYRENKAGEGQGGCEGRLFSHTVVSALCDPMDCSTPGSAVCGVSQARILDWVAISFSRGSSRLRDQTLRSSALQADSLPSEPPGKPTANCRCYINDQETSFPQGT